MITKKDAREIITALETNGFYAECPCCGEPVKLKDCGLFFLDEFSEEARILYEEQLKELKVKREQLKNEQTKISKKSENTSKSVNIEPTPILRTQNKATIFVKITNKGAKNERKKKLI